MSRPRPARQIACHHLILPDGTEQYMAVAEFDVSGRFIGSHPLTAEEPFVEWQAGTLTIQ